MFGFKSDDLFNFAIIHQLILIANVKFVECMVHVPPGPDHNKCVSCGQGIMCPCVNT